MIKGWLTQAQEAAEMRANGIVGAATRGKAFQDKLNFVKKLQKEIDFDGDDNDGNNSDEKGEVKLAARNSTSK